MWPAIAAVLAGGAILAGTGMQIAATGKQNRALKKEARFNAQAEADLALQTEIATRYKVYGATRAFQANLGSAFAAAGAGLGGGLSGNAQDIILDNTIQEQMDILALRYEGYNQLKSHVDASLAGVRSAENIKSMQPYQLGSTIFGGISQLAQLGVSYSALGK